MFNYQKEKLKWINNKEKEEKILKEYNIEESIIKELYEYDWYDFRKERNYMNKIDMFELEEIESVSLNYIHTYDDLLEYINDESLFKLLSNVDELTKTIIFFKYHDYSYEEISKILNVKNYIIHYKIRKLKKYYKK